MLPIEKPWEEKDSFYSGFQRIQSTGTWESVEVMRIYGRDCAQEVQKKTAQESRTICSQRPASPTWSFLPIFPEFIKADSTARKQIFDKWPCNQSLTLGKLPEILFSYKFKNVVCRTSESGCSLFVFSWDTYSLLSFQVELCPGWKLDMRSIVNTSLSYLFYGYFSIILFLYLYTDSLSGWTVL